MSRTVEDQDGCTVASFMELKDIVFCSYRYHGIIGPYPRFRTPIVYDGRPICSLIILSYIINIDLPG